MRDHAEDRLTALADRAWWKRPFGPPAGGWTSAGQPLTPPSTPRAETDRTERDLLGQIARDVATIRSVVVTAFWLSVIAGVLLAWSAYSSS